MLRRLVLGIALAAASVAHAQTYKWVDERGVTNYSNTPPARGAASTIEDRVSVVESEPLQAQAAAVERRLALQEAEWLQRQRLMALAQPQLPLYPSDYYSAPVYYPVAFVSHRARAPRVIGGGRGHRGSRR